MLGKGYQLTEAGKETRIRRRDMRTLAQVWLTFLLANVMPTGHVSDINVVKSNLLFSMMQDDFTINIVRVISDEIQKVVDEERVGRGERRGTLGFPALITTLCEDQGVFVDPKVKIRAPIDLKFIQLHCTNPEEYPEQRNRASSPLKSPSSPTLEAVEKRIVRYVLHMEDQQSAICRFMMQIYHSMRDKTFMNDEELSSYLNWPGDRPSSVGGAEPRGDEVQSDAGNKGALVDNEPVNDPPNEPGVEKEPPVAPATKEPAVASHAEPPTESPAEPPVEPCEDSPVRKKTPVRSAGPSEKKAKSPAKEASGNESSRRTTRSSKAGSPLKEPSVAEPVRRSKRARRTVAGTLAVIEEIEPLKTQFVISSDSDGEEQARDEEESVSNEEAAIGNFASDEDTEDEDSNY